ncbi:INO80 complex subunit D [Ricinus communis]|uniref:INO80 complex subunit D n=1 Tax=Ricinus communis TaxID=3988 RepID=UPI00201B0ED2|nr:INO80 complex subunit D [Ricinus communis]
MTTASKNHHNHNHQPSSSRPPKNPNPNTSTTTLTNFPNPNNNPNPNSSTITTSTHSPQVVLSQQDQYLSRATHLTRQELLKRRAFNLKQLSKCYRDYYWALMEDLKVQYREYYWKYGVSPFKDDHPSLLQRQQKAEHGVERESGEREGGGNTVNNEVIGENNNNGVKGGFGGDLEMKSNNSNNNNRCLFVGCKLKAMALTSFCHLHILSDAKQKLYKPCGYVIKSAQAGPITCGKPILRSSAPSLCTVHFQKAQKHVTRALKKAGLNVSSSSKLAPKFHVIVAEYVRQIQARRKATRRANRIKGSDKDKDGSAS